MKKIKQKLTITTDRGLFHDSRKDVRLLSKVINEIIDNNNAMIDEINKLKKFIKEHCGQ